MQVRLNAGQSRTSRAPSARRPHRTPGPRIVHRGTPRERLEAGQAVRMCAILAGIAILLAAVGCRRTADESARSQPAEIDVTTLVPQGGDGLGPSTAAAPTGTRELVLLPDQPLDLFLRVPAQARLVFSLPAGAD